MALRVRESKSRAQAAGRKRREFILDGDTHTLFESLRAAAGFSSKEGSAFLEALLLKVSGRPWYGPAFLLPIERGTHD